MGVGDTGESCLLTMVIILFIILCQNLKHKSWTLKGSKQKGALRGQKNLERFLPQGARGCVHMDVGT